MTFGQAGTGDTTSASMLLSSAAPAIAPAAAPLDPVKAVEARINLAVRPGGQPLTVRSLELYLIRGLNTVDVGHGPEVIVAFDPEFFYVADVGLKARAGVSVFWSNGLGAGDPGFPDFTASKLRSITGTSPSSLIYPAVAGELLIGVDAAMPPEDVTAGLQANRLWDVRISGALVEARCDPFEEVAVCAALPAKLPFIRYAESNRVVRMIEIHPGWTAVRIA